MRISTAFKRLLRLSGRSVVDVSFTSRGRARDGPLAPPAAGVRRVRPDRPAAGDPRPARQALAASRSRCRAAAGSSASCGGCAAATCGVRLEPVRGRGRAQRTRATSKMSWRGWRSRWRSRRSPGCSGSAGTRSARSSRASSLISSMSAVWRDWSRSASTRSATAAITATDSVADHRTGAIVWSALGRNSATLRRFFDELGDRESSIRAV